LYGAIIAGALSLSDVFALSLSPSEPPTEYLFVRESGKHDEKLVTQKREKTNNKLSYFFSKKSFVCDDYLLGACLTTLFARAPTIH
jgi:hypothetical protein